MLRRRLVALAVVLAVLLACFIVVLLHSGTPNCTVVVEHPALPASLTALGDFQQPYDAGSPTTLDDVAVRAASAEYPALIGATAGSPVRVLGAGGRPTALVIPLRAALPPGGATSPPAIVGLVVFEEDCAGNAYFHSVENDARAQPPMQSFPPVSRTAAASALATSDVHLEYTLSPLRPQWVTAASPAASLAAR